ncbi:hypothetical protein HNP38_000288 [Chryseobacterium defluvii]|uniref:Uncharacterized protein n=1 Tax=Chryseobacterium defluvii TaxID=160396 RepID=A0A840K721_9FLAO|nr:hypothetical protein [Chryseobacterium defluvii]MBB4805016.1 hypothetical protein [Chryseobacterium defluvii]
MSRVIPFLFFFITILIKSQIGINTANPTETLDVNGTMRVRNISSLGSNASAKDSILVFDNDGVLKRVTASQILTQANGITSISTSGVISGNGTSSNPVTLGQNGAANGQLLQWNGTGWVPVSASSLGTISLNTGTSGANINVSGSPAALGGSITLNIPDAGAAARGVVNTASQVFAGTKMFSAVGINTTTPNASASLDANGAYKLGSTGTVNKNMISFSATVNNNINSGTSAFLGGLSASRVLDIDITVPAANRPTSTQAVVNVSPAFDLPGSVSIASARLTSVSNVRVRFLNNDVSNSQTISGTLYVKINEF